MEKECDKCGKLTKLKYLKKIRGVLFCKHCAKELRLKRRKETIELSGIGEELKRLSKKLKTESQKRYYEARKKIYKPKEHKDYKQKIKNSNKKKKIKKTYITMQEKQLLFGILIKRGYSYNEADERVKELVKSQNNLTIELKNKNKSEEEIKLQRERLLEELWNY